MLMPLHGNRVLKCVLCSWECSHDLINSAEGDEMWPKQAEACSLFSLACSSVSLGDQMEYIEQEYR